MALAYQWAMSVHSKAVTFIRMILSGTAGLAVCLHAGTLAAQQPAPPPGPPATQWSGGGLKLEVAPLLIEPATAFFLNRGFPFAEAERIAREGCVFRSSIGHSGNTPEPISIDVRQWRVMPVGRGEQTYKSKEDWLESFTAADVPEKAMIAFRWALFPTTAKFGPDDYNWGIHAFGLPMGTRFDLRLVWRQGKTRHETQLKGLTCSKY